MEAKGGLIEGLIVGGTGRIPDGREEEMGDADKCMRSCKKRRIFVFRLPFGAIFFVVLPGQSFAQLAPAAAVQHWFVPVLAQSPGNNVLVGVEIHDNHRFAKGLH